MHKIAIPEYAVRTAMARRGRLRKYERLEPAKTALLVIDMQNAFLLQGMSVEHPHARDIVPNINRIAAALRASGGVVVWLQVSFAGVGDDWSTFFDNHLTPNVKERMIRELSPGNPGFEIYSGLDVQKGDVIVVKNRLSAFVSGSSDLDRVLKGRGLDTVIVTGTVTNGCCESTARDAMQMNYKTVFISDGNATRTDEEHNATLANMLQTFADVLSTEEAVAALQGELLEASARR